MREALIQSFQNLRANKLRSFLTMFGILWGMISVVVLSATGEGFRRGNEKVLLELGKNIGIVWGGRTSLQAGGERAGRADPLTLDDARAIAAESSMVAVVSPELERSAVSVKSAYNAATARVTGIEPPYQDIRTIELEYGRHFTWNDEEQVARVAIVGYDMADQLFGKRHILGEPLTLNGLPYTVVGKIRKKNQDSNYSGPGQQQDLRPVRHDDARPAAPRRRAGHAVGHHRRAEGLGGRCAAGGARRAHRPHRGHRLAARAERPRHPRAAARLRPRRPAGDRRCGTPRCRR